RFVFFTFDGANLDHFDHTLVSLRGDGGKTFHFEDTFGGGDRDFNDAVISVTRSFAIPTPGQTSQVVQANFLRVQRLAAYHNEVGLFLVDKADGSIGTLKPGDPGYAQAALASASRQVIFSDTTMRGVTFRTLTLQGGSFYVFYLIANGTTDQFLSRNPSDSASARPLAYFSFPTANPDGRDHLNWRKPNEIGFEDMPNLGDADFNDMVIQYGFGTPQGPQLKGPTFTASNPPTAPFNTAAVTQTVPGFATFSPGTAPGSGQTATYTISNVTNAGLFATPPSVDPNGTLTYTPKAGGFGSSQFTVTVSDGKTSSAPQTFTINVSPTLGAPDTLNGSDGNSFSLNDPNWQAIPTLLSDADPTQGS